MAMLDVHILVQVILYLLAAVTGFVISIPVGINRMNFKGMCILYAKFRRNGSHFIMTESPATNCIFPVYFSVFGLIFYGLGLGIYNGYSVAKSIKDQYIGSQMWVMPFILMNSLVGVNVLVIACMLSVGFSQFCDGLEKESGYTSCSAAEGATWTNFKDGEKFDVGSYYKLMTTAEVAAWLCFLVMVLQVAMGVLRFVRNRRQRSLKIVKPNAV